MGSSGFLPAVLCRFTTGCPTFWVETSRPSPQPLSSVRVGAHRLLTLACLSPLLTVAPPLQLRLCLLRPRFPQRLCLPTSRCGPPPRFSLPPPWSGTPSSPGSFQRLPVTSHLPHTLPTRYPPISSGCRTLPSNGLPHLCLQSLPIPPSAPSICSNTVHASLPTPKGISGPLNCFSTLSPFTHTRRSGPAHSPPRIPPLAQLAGAGLLLSLQQPGSCRHLATGTLLLNSWSLHSLPSFP